MVTVVLRNVRPRDHQDLPISQIAELRAGAADARTELQRTLQALVFDDGGYLHEIRDAAKLESRLNDLYNKQLKPSLDAMEKATQARHRVDWKDTLAASFQVPPDVIEALGHPLAWPLLVVCADGALAVAVWQSRKGRPDLKMQDPVALYLHQVSSLNEEAVINAVVGRLPDPWSTLP